jgi:hypothetical protein
MANTFNAITTGTGGISTAGDTSGTFAFASNGTTVATISATGVINATSVTGLTTALTVAQGGTGAATLTANNVLLGNGTSAVQVVAPGTSGNVLTSNGTTWASTAIPSSTPTTAQVGTASAGFAVGDLGTYAFLCQSTNTATTISYGSNYAGSGFRYAGVAATGSGTDDWNITSYPAATAKIGNSSGTPSGTWKAMGNFTPAANSIQRGTLFLRVA